MCHPPDIEGRFEQARSRTNREGPRFTVECRVKSFRRFAEGNPKFVERPILSREIFVNEVRGPDVFAALAVFPAAIDVVSWVPEAIPIDVAEPGEPPVDHLRSASRHPGQSGDDPFAILKFLIA